VADNIADLRAQAERYLRLAKACTDAPMCASLTALAADSLERADKLSGDAQPLMTPTE
jgi:hypothetical protein